MYENIYQAKGFSYFSNIMKVFILYYAFFSLTLHSNKKFTNHHLSYEQSTLHDARRISLKGGCT